MGIAYRREIDGLRAIAVAAVVAYHAGLGGAGYVGVDIFFVISGYLITALLLRELDERESIDLWDFYARRVRRIFPAAAVLILVVLGLAVVLEPGEAAQVARSAAAAAAFVANLHFQAQTGGYWGADATQMPLLHLWSLSVEEQFYLAWPAVLMLVPRARLRPALLVLAVAALAFCEWLLRSRPEAAFYQMPARAWELAAGAIVATVPPRRLPPALAWVALAGLLVACVLPFAHFPGLGALPAVTAATLLLAAVHGGGTNPLLSSRPMVGLGLVSYSLYLWHWPLLAFDRMQRVGPSPLSVRLVLVGLALLLAIASYRYVEQPLRRSRAPSRRTVAVGFAAMFALACGAWTWQHAALVPQPRAKLSPAQLAAADRPPDALCNYYPQQAIEPFPAPNCAPAHPDVATWGDSLAHSWQPYAQTLGSPFIGFTRAGCPPLLGEPIPDRARVESDLCRQFNAKVADWIVVHRPRTVVMAGRWSYYRRTQVETGLRASLLRIAPSVDRIIVFGPSPQLPDSLPKCMELGRDCAISRAEVEAANREAIAMMARMAALPKVEVVDPLPFLCSRTRCPGIRGGVPLYSDSLHISSRAARAFAFRLPPEASAGYNSAPR